jgi:catechol 2,3-dioxygenase-like lactoylglutathione lyase family enzyme
MKYDANGPCGARFHVQLGSAMIKSLHHIQLAMPKGGEAAARGFYCAVLGMVEVEKPDVLRGRGGVWFETGAVRVHLGVEEPFAAARKAHPAFEVVNLEATTAQLEKLGIGYRRDIDLPRMRRVYVEDPFGNRIELLELG